MKLLLENFITIIFVLILFRPLPVSIAQEKGKMTIDKAITLGKIEILKTVIANDVSIENHHLHLAASRGDIDIAQLLLSKGVDINAKNERGLTPLHEASFQGQVGMVKLLLAEGADINAKDKRGQTPLHEAAQIGQFQIFKELLTQGADINASKTQITLFPYCEDLLSYSNDEGFFCETLPKERQIDCNNHGLYTPTAEEGVFSFINEFVDKMTYSKSKAFSSIKNQCHFHNKIICKLNTDVEKNKSISCENGKRYSLMSTQSVHNQKRLRAKESGVQSENQNGHPTQGVLP